MFATFLLTSTTGWAAALLVGVTSALPYVLGRGSSTSTIRRLGPFLSRLRPHYWLGYALLGLSTIHAALTLNNQAIVHASRPVGIALASGGLALLVGQLVLGLRLNGPCRGRGRLRRWHFRAMLGVAALGIGHLVLNSPLLGALLP